MIMARNEDGTYSQVGFVKDNAGIDTEYIYDKDGDIVFEKGFTRETSGTVPLTINGIEKDLKAWSITGNMVQNGTPMPENPVEVQAVGDRTGNVFPAGEKKTVVSNGITFDSDGSGRYHISGTASAHSSVSFNLVSGFTAPTSVSNGGQGTLSFFNTQPNSSVAFAFYNGTTKVDDWTMVSINRTSVSYNAMGNKYIDKVIIIVNSGATVDMTIMPEFTNDGVLPTEFEPYGYKIPVVTRGKNLAGNYTVSSGYYYDDSGTPTHSDARFIRLIINVEPNTIYTISSNLKFYSIWEFNNNTKISRRNGSNSNKYTIKTSKECNSLRISMINTSGEADTSAFEWIQLEEGSTATPYEPYHEPITTPIYLPTPLYSGEVLRSDGTITRSDGTTETFTAPQIPTLNGTTVIDVDTVVKPTEMYTKYKSSK